MRFSFLTPNQMARFKKPLIDEKWQATG